MKLEPISKISLTEKSRFTLLLLCMASLLSCTSGKVEEEADWKEMDDFHMVMAESFHPYRDSGNIQPVRQYAEEMASLADSWSKSELPARVSTDEVKTVLAQLKTETQELSTIVASQDSIAIGESLTHVHDIFHKLQESWYKGGSGHQEEDHH
jgi:hypothetical protein